MEQILSFMELISDSLRPALQSAAILAGAVALGLISQSVFFFLMRRLKKKAGKTLGGLSATKFFGGPTRLLLPLVFVRLVLPFLSMQDEYLEFFGNALSLLLIGSGAWFLVRAANLAEAFFLGLYRIDGPDNFEARKIHTQIRYLKRIAVVVVFVLAGGSMLMMFDRVRQFGVGILTSAGIAGIVIGLAAQRSIANLLVGVQIAITQPIRIEDVVIVENEWGWIEEITSTYVVVRLWDLRRLIVPLTYFTEKPFQNWTRGSSNIVGSVFLSADYSIPVNEIRKELYRILQGSELWDGQTCVLQVTNATEKTIELRALVSASNAPRAWDLRCEVREKLIAFLQTNYPSCLPRVRAEIDPDTASYGISGKEREKGAMLGGRRRK